MGMWHLLLCLLHIRKAADYAPPGLGPEVPHPYMAHTSLDCCEHCGGGRLNAIHKPPFNPRRLAEILGNAPYAMKHWEGPGGPRAVE